MFVSLPIHLIIIAIFFAFRYVTQKINEYSRSKMLPTQGIPTYILVPMLMFIMFIVQGFSNRQQLMQKCNVDMSQTAFMTSAITIFLIFGSIVSLIESIPLLKSPFDNTFGYFLCGMNVETVRTVINKIYIPNIRKDDSNILESILSNEALQLNTVKPLNFQMKILPLNIPENSNNNNTLMKYYNLVLRKDLIGSAVLYILAAALAVLINSESMNNIKCKKTDEDIVKNLSSINLE
jgi:hypothetical protein